ncbi:MAG: ClpXP protease specificity-enhancing factor SspB, partial [Pseudomonadales bacterium]
MTPSRPYMLRALYEWILDNNATPHILVNAMHSGVQVPQDYVKD